MAKTPVLLDTDIGSDIDDAVALAYLLKQPECELLGVTTVRDKPEQRAMLADAVCRAFGRSDVPVFSGTAGPLLVHRHPSPPPQASVLPRWAHRDKFAPNAAVDFLRQTIRSRPGELTLLSVGPLTNVGLLYALDPEIPTLLKQHVLMAGHYRNAAVDLRGPVEWNVLCDPHAAALVFAAHVPKVVCVGLDVTTRCQMPVDECRRRFAEGPLKIVADMAEVWFTRSPKITFHDPLAAALVFEPDLCTYTPGTVSVELASPRLAGFTFFDTGGESPRHHVATTVDADRFFKNYFTHVVP
jgi:purine nucleosidase